MDKKQHLPIAQSYTRMILCITYIGVQIPLFPTENDCGCFIPMLTFSRANDLQKGGLSIIICVCHQLQQISMMTQRQNNKLHHVPSHNSPNGSRTSCPTNGSTLPMFLLCVLFLGKVLPYSPTIYRILSGLYLSSLLHVIMANLRYPACLHKSWRSLMLLHVFVKQTTQHRRSNSRFKASIELFWLVSTPLTNMSSSVGMMTFPIYRKQ